MYECMMATGWQIKAVRNKPHGVIAAVIYSTASAIAKAKAKPEAKAVRHATTHSWWWCMDVARGVWVLPWGKGRGGGWCRVALEFQHRWMHERTWPVGVARSTARNKWKAYFFILQI